MAGTSAGRSSRRVTAARHDKGGRVETSQVTDAASGQTRLDIDGASDHHACMAPPESLRTFLITATGERSVLQRVDLEMTTHLERWNRSAAIHNASPPYARALSPVSPEEHEYLVDGLIRDLEAAQVSIDTQLTSGRQLLSVVSGDHYRSNEAALLYARVEELATQRAEVATRLARLMDARQPWGPNATLRDFRWSLEGPGAGPPGGGGGGGTFITDELENGEVLAEGLATTTRMAELLHLGGRAAFLLDIATMGGPREEPLPEDVAAAIREGVAGQAEAFARAQPHVRALEGANGTTPVWLEFTVRLDVTPLVGDQGGSSPVTLDGVSRPYLVTDPIGAQVRRLDADEWAFVVRIPANDAAATYDNHLHDAGSDDDESPDPSPHADAGAPGGVGGAPDASVQDPSAGTGSVERQVPPEVSGWYSAADAYGHERHYHSPDGRQLDADDPARSVASHEPRVPTSPGHSQPTRTRSSPSTDDDDSPAGGPATAGLPRPVGDVDSSPGSVRGQGSIRAEASEDEPDAHVVTSRDANYTDAQGHEVQVDTSDSAPQGQVAAVPMSQQPQIAPPVTSPPADGWREADTGVQAASGTSVAHTDGDGWADAAQADVSSPGADADTATENDTGDAVTVGDSGGADGNDYAQSDDYARPNPSTYQQTWLH
jgi:hypothetical protein